MKASTTRVSLTDGAKLMTETLPNTIVKVVDSLTETGTVVYFERFNHGLNVDLWVWMWSATPQMLGRLPEGVAEVHTPSFQLFWVMGCHVGKFSKDVKVRGVSWWREQRIKWCHFNQTCSKLMNSQNMLCVEVKNTSNEGNPRQESFMNGRQKRAEAPWSFPFSTLQILSLYFSCVHGNGWIHKHTKSSWTL